IMPGKVNPVIPELVNLIAFRVIGNDYSVSLAGTHGQLQLAKVGRLWCGSSYVSCWRASSWERASEELGWALSRDSGWLF
ncbi:MAG TPA: hypothetical protein VGZ25_13705, partial [Gemmataceae bacterium]|nr:hypothetical protein [Gemmataceae bacterium]